MTHSTPRVSVIVPAHPDEKGLVACLHSIYSAAHSFEGDVELLVVTPSVVNDACTIPPPRNVRLRWLETGRTLGPSAARNLGWRASTEDLCFFVDSDCVVSRGWLAAGHEAFSNPAIGAIEGSIRYGNATPTVRDRIPVNPIYNLPCAPLLTTASQDFAAANIAYRRTLLESTGGFDDLHFENGREDTDLGKKVAMTSEIKYLPEMAVIHRPSVWTIWDLVENARRYRSDVVFFKRWSDFPFRYGRILHPRLLGMAVFPPLFFIEIFPWIRSVRDLRFSIVLYCYLWLARYHIWSSGFKHRTFVV